MSEPLLFLYGFRIVNHLQAPLIAPFFRISLERSGFLPGCASDLVARPAGSATRCVARPAGRSRAHRLPAHQRARNGGLLLAGRRGRLSANPRGDVIVVSARCGRATSPPTLASGWSCMCLLVAGSSSEAGATFVVCFALLQALWFVVDRALPSHRQPPKACRIYRWLFPGALSAMLLVVVRFNRYHVVERPAATASTACRPMGAVAFWRARKRCFLKLREARRITGTASEFVSCRRDLPGARHYPLLVTQETTGSLQPESTRHAVGSSAAGVAIHGGCLLSPFWRIML